MSEYLIFIYAAVLILGFGIFSRLAEKSIVTPPMVFVLFGIIASFSELTLLREEFMPPLLKLLPN